VESVVERGLTEHLARWHSAIQGGASRLGFKVAFNVRAVQERLGLSYSLVAGLTGATLLPSGAVLSLSGTKGPAVEAEVAVWLGADVAPGGTAADAARAISKFAPAIEFVDLNRGFDDLEAILREGVFHRAVVLGEPVPAPPGADLAGCAVHVRYGDAEQPPLDARVATGDAGAVLLHLATLLAPFGEALRAGDLVILGSMNPLTFAEAGKDFAVTIDGIGSVSASLTA
jgi:2-keto-4-pentenoate hydratase